MPRVLNPLFLSLVLVIIPALAVSQTARSSNSGTSVQQAIELAEKGQCASALPLLKRTIRQISDKELKKRAGLDGLHCAMTHDAPYESLIFLDVLSHEFPRDPEVLYASTHTFSDLSLM